MKRRLFWVGNIVFWTILFVVFVELGYSNYKLLISENHYKDNYIITYIDYIPESIDQERHGRNYTILGKIQSTNYIQGVDFKKMTTFCDTLSIPEVGDTIPIWNITNFKISPIVPRAGNQYPYDILKKMVFQSFSLVALMFLGICFSIIKFCKSNA